MPRHDIRNGEGRFCSAADPEATRVLAHVRCREASILRVTTGDIQGTEDRVTAAAMATQDRIDRREAAGAQYQRLGDAVRDANAAMQGVTRAMRAPVQRRDRQRQVEEVNRRQRQLDRLERNDGWYEVEWAAEDIDYRIDMGRQVYHVQQAYRVPTPTYTRTTRTGDYWYTNTGTGNIVINNGTVTTNGGYANVHWQYNTPTTVTMNNYTWNTTAYDVYDARRAEERWREQLWGQWRGPYVARREDLLDRFETVWTGWVRNNTTGERVEMNINVPHQVWHAWGDDFEENIREEMRAEFERHMRNGTRPEWELTDEQREAIERAEQERRDREQAERERINRERLARQQLIDQAEQRAKELLEMVLTPEEHLLHERNGEFTVRGSDGYLYLIQTTSRQTVHGNIKRTDEHGCKLGTVCVAPAMYDGNQAIPLADGWVGQYLGLRHNAEEFLRHGNWSYVRNCQHPGVPVINGEVDETALATDAARIVEERHDEARLREQIQREVDRRVRAGERVIPPPAEENQRGRLARIFGAA